MKLICAAGILCLFWTAVAPAADTAALPGSTNALANPRTDKQIEAQTPGQTLTNSAGMQLVKVPGGFWAGKFEVTQAEYTKVMGGNPSAFSGGAHPVDNVSWQDAMDFCRRLTALDHDKKVLPQKFYYTLPTEDEWEGLVADATLAEAVSSQGGRRDGTSDVGSLGPNSLGLYDIRGNVMEFCLGDETKPYRVLRGGCWQDFIEINLRVAFRYYCKPDEHKNIFGFRCVLKDA